MNERRNYDELLEQLKETVSAQIKITVNGKIDKIDAKIDAIHNRLDDQDKVLIELKPVRDGLNAWNFNVGILKGVAAVLIAIGVIFTTFKVFFPEGTYSYKKTSESDIQNSVKDQINRELDNRTLIENK